MKTRKEIMHNIILYIVFVFYLFILFLLLFCKRTSMQSVNFIPFLSLQEALSKENLLRGFAINNILGNIILFIPLGVYVGLFNRNKKIVINTLFVIGISVLVEIVQYICKVGVTDIDDVILNGLGGFFGACIYSILQMIFKGKTKRAIEILAPIGGGIAFMILIMLNR